MPTANRSGHLDRTVDPVDRQSDDPCRISTKGKFGKLEEILNLGRELVFFIRAKRIGHLGFFSVQPKLLSL